MLMRPPNGDHAARPVSSYSTNRMWGEPCGAFVGTIGCQCATESRPSSLMTPLNFLSLIVDSPLIASGGLPGESTRLHVPGTRHRRLYGPARRELRGWRRLRARELLLPVDAHSRLASRRRSMTS